MAPETNESISYLAALKRSIATEDAAAHAQENSGSALASQQPGTQEHLRGAERRRSPRYQCQGSVEMREEGSDVHTWATVTDISLHGCYVEAQATFPAGTVLQLKLEAKEIKVLTKGTVRVNYPYLGMGIAFSEMADEERVKLKVLLASIARPSVIIGPGIASSLPASEPLKGVPLIHQPDAAIRALVQFFESRQMLMRDDFLRILRTSQASKVHS